TRFRAAVADGGARFHRALALDRTGAGEDRFEQRGLAALERAHQRDAPGTLWTIAVLSHFAASSWPLVFCRSRASASPCVIVSGRGRTGKGTDLTPQMKRKSPS